MDERQRRQHNAVLDLLDMARQEAEGVYGHALADWAYTGQVERPQIMARCKRCDAVALVDYLTPAVLVDDSIATRYPCLYDYPVA
jgi:hypothetical protein